MTEEAYMVLSEISFGILDRILLEFDNIKQACQQLTSAFININLICEQTVTLASNAKQDYDVIFESLKKLYDNPTNDCLRQKVQDQIDQRLQIIYPLIDRAADTTATIRSSMDSSVDNQVELKKIVDEIIQATTGGGCILLYIVCLVFGLRFPGEILQDIEAVKAIEHTISEVTSHSDAVLHDMEVLLGGWDAISNDLKYLSDFVRSNTDPSPGPLADLEESAILNKWELLKDEVNQFQQSHVLPALSAHASVANSRVKAAVAFD
ncbi:hypothetical protein VTN02DRAFT_4188 [Thermoascus thermophilus]